MQKLEILQQFKKLYGDKINPGLLSIKYCQTPSKAIIELKLINQIQPVLLNLDFIRDEPVIDDAGNETNCTPLFNPENDIIDNATAFIELDSYSLINCIEGLFNPDAQAEIANNYMNTNLTPTKID